MAGETNSEYVEDSAIRCRDIHGMSDFGYKISQPVSREFDLKFDTTNIYR